MTTPRRRLIRPTLPTTTTSATVLQLQKLRGKLDKDRRDLARWMSRLRRAFNCVQNIKAASPAWSG